MGNERERQVEREKCEEIMRRNDGFFLEDVGVRMSWRSICDLERKFQKIFGFFD